ncbi:MAG: GDP-mannose 4,6-dehydratase [Candidatus Altiarchaeales archaeon WOR_SM1_79]|nr:MAG: GDP-mannose 4,6-dehydratase [Candidatus Altiarchaeales archaeon WOR_SM1_79]
MTNKRALVTGISGQVGSYLAELLLSKGYDVFGLVRRHASDGSLWRIKPILDKINMVEGDLTDQSSLNKAIENATPDEVYNLGSQSFVGVSWKQPEYTANVTGLGALRMLEAVRNYDDSVKFYQASSSEMFGMVRESPQNEDTPFYPRSPYGIAKLYAHWMTINYRESYEMFTVSGICFNMESPRRGIEFVTKKITDGVAKISLGLSNGLILGNLNAKRDWGYAPDYVEAMWMSLQQEEPDDFVIATGETHSVKEFAEEAFSYIDLDYRDYIKQDREFMRPAEVDLLVGDASKARKKLGWKPKVRFKELVKVMMEYDLERLEKT